MPRAKNEINSMQTHHIIVDGSMHELETDDIKFYKDKIPIELAHIESCISLEDWQTLYPNTKTITSKQYHEGSKIILENRRFLIRIKS
jgi:hypothetical protein